MAPEPFLTEVTPQITPLIILLLTAELHKEAHDRAGFVPFLLLIISGDSIFGGNGHKASVNTLLTPFHRLHSAEKATTNKKTVTSDSGKGQLTSEALLEKCHCQQFSTDW